MNKSYRGAYERMADKAIAEDNPEICINWINMSAKEAGSGGADRVTRKLIDAGYRPDAAGDLAQERYGGTGYAVRTLFAGKNVNPDHVIEVLAKSMADTITKFAGGDMRKLDEYIPDFMTEFMFAAADKCRRR